MNSIATTARRAWTGLSLFALTLVVAPMVSATTTGTGAALTSASALETFLQSIADLFTGGLGIAIGIIAFAAVGVYIMYARQTGQAVGSIAKVFVGLLILFGGTTMVAEIGAATGGAAF
ncbi:MAG: TrbC/VirB2 family protein [Bacteroidota bacterium]